MDIDTNRSIRRTRSRRDRRGAALVEFALVGPVFFLLVFTMFEFSRLNVIRHTADNAAYEAARAAMVPGATAADAIAEAQRIMAIAGTRGATVQVTPSVITPRTQRVTVAIDVPMSRNALIVSKFTRSTVIHAESSRRTERAATR